eukprot:gene26251-17351_t
MFFPHSGPSQPKAKPTKVSAPPASRDSPKQSAKQLMDQKTHQKPKAASKAGGTSGTGSAPASGSGATFVVSSSFGYSPDGFHSYCPPVIAHHGVFATAAEAQEHAQEVFYKNNHWGWKEEDMKEEMEITFKSRDPMGGYYEVCPDDSGEWKVTWRCVAPTNGQGSSAGSRGGATSNALFVVKKSSGYPGAGFHGSGVHGFHSYEEPEEEIDRVHSPSYEEWEEEIDSVHSTRVDAQDRAVSLFFDGNPWDLSEDGTWATNTKVHKVKAGDGEFWRVEIYMDSMKPNSRTELLALTAFVVALRTAAAGLCLVPTLFVTLPSVFRRVSLTQTPATPSSSAAPAGHILLPAKVATRANRDDAFGCERSMAPSPNYTDIATTFCSALLPPTPTDTPDPSIRKLLPRQLTAPAGFVTLDNGFDCPLPGTTESTKATFGAYQLAVNPETGNSSTGIVATHCVLIPGTHKVLLFSRQINIDRFPTQPGMANSVSSVYDPYAGTYVPTPMPEHPFCAGHSHLRDGTIIVTGGEAPGGAKYSWLKEGRKSIRTFNPSTLQWTTLPQLLNSNHWYPTQLTLPDGRVIVAGGSKTETGPPNPETEIIDTRTSPYTVSHKGLDSSRTFRYFAAEAESGDQRWHHTSTDFHKDLEEEARELIPQHDFQV